MPQWTDNLITATRRTPQGGPITMLRVMRSGPGGVGHHGDFTRASVVNSIESGTRFSTARLTPEGKYRLGEDVRVVVIRGQKYLRTDSNGVQSDNLGDLPSF